jgi:hypothetical protein
MRQVITEMLAPLMKDWRDKMRESNRRRRGGPKEVWVPLLLLSCTILMAWDSSPTLAERFEASGITLAALFPRRPRGMSYQGWIKAMRRHKELIDCAADCLRGRMKNKAGSWWYRFGWCLLAADGSKINCPATDANKALGCAGRKKSCPQLLLVTLWHMGLGLPWAWRVQPGIGSERQALREMIGRLPRRSLLVADAGFVGYELLADLGRANKSFLIRVGSNVRLLQKLGYFQREGEQTVYLWPDNQQKTDRKTGWPKGKPLTLRLIAVNGRQGKTMHLLTNVLESSKLSDRAAQRIYTLRWGIELFYRSLKQKLQRRKMCSAAPEQAKVELHGSMLGMMMLGLMSVERIIARGKDPLGWSMAMTLRCIRRVVRQGTKRPRAGAATLAEQLAASLKDSYVRTGTKVAKNYPRKKKEKPPGEPKVRTATDVEIALAQEIYDDRVAA